MEGLLLLILLLVIYFLPTFIAGARSHHNGLAIFLLNLLLGWTFLGWALALIWSATAVRQAPPPQGVPQSPPEQSPPSKEPQASEGVPEAEEAGNRMHWEAIPTEAKVGVAGVAAVAVVVVLMVLAGGNGASPPSGRGTVSPEALSAVARRQACAAAVEEARLAFNRAQEERWEFSGIVDVPDIEGEDEVVGCVPSFNTGAAGGSVLDAVVVARREPLRHNWTTAYLVQVQSADGEVLARGMSPEVLSELQGEEAADNAASAEARIAERERARREASERMRQAAIGRQWRSSTSRSQMMDFTNHYLSVGPEAPIRDRFGRELGVRLWVRCMEDTTSIFIEADEYLGLDDISVQWRIDDQAAFQRTAYISTDNEAFGLWRGSQSIPFIGPILGADYLTVRYTPYGESPRTARFHVEGLDNRITSLRRACGW